MRKMRQYELDVTPFAGGVVERVQVWAENRGRAFSLAVQQAINPLNVWAVRLVSDGDQIIDPEDRECRRVEDGYDTPIRDVGVGMSTHRAYDVGIELFGGVWTSVAVGARGRVNAFTEAVIGSTTPDSVWRTKLRAVGEGIEDCITGEYQSIDSNKEYGGVIFDLEDGGPRDPRVRRAAEARASASTPQRMGHTDDATQTWFRELRLTPALRQLWPRCQRALGHYSCSRHVSDHSAFHNQSVF